ncbi:hypothetical protein C806_00568 [Lachnospiraceae bacterium 3-1]|nr:hypothetical protein C806_00568 [Lachnospiraceae bacterium 3-1]
MKTNYGKLGQESMDSLKNTSERSAQVQMQLLAELMHRNRETVYGKKYGFGTIKTVGEFQKKVPLCVYGDYEDYILRMIAGEEKVLTEEPVVYYCISSGTTGNAKYLPLTETDLKIQYTYAYGVPFGMIKDYYRNLPENEVFGKIFQIGEFAKTYMENGTMNGIRSGCVYQWLDRDGQFDAEDYCVPKEVLFPDTLEDLCYVKVRFALAEQDLRAIHGVFVNRVAGVLDYIYRNWEMLLKDMERGRVDECVSLSTKWRKYVEQKLPPNPLRAAQLRLLSHDTLHKGIIKKIWPRVRYVLAIGGKSFAYYTEKMQEYAGDIPIHPYAYAASEGIFGIAEKMDQTDRYILFPEAGFFEFLPLNEAQIEEKRPLFMWEVNIGERYELVFTNHSGLYRYCMGDVIEVVDWYGQAPIVQFCYRKNQVLNIAGEKSNQEQLAEAVRQFAFHMHCEIIGYCVQEDMSDLLPRYQFYLECTNLNISGAEDILDECLCRVNYEYQGCRKMNEIGKVRISYLCAGSFGRYEEQLAKNGKMMGQSKQVCILDTEEKKQFFAVRENKSAVGERKT